MVIKKNPWGEGFKIYIFNYDFDDSATSIIVKKIRIYFQVPINKIDVILVVIQCILCNNIYVIQIIVLKIYI